jgi:hypothetical protein
VQVDGFDLPAQSHVGIVTNGRPQPLCRAARPLY